EHRNEADRDDQQREKERATHAFGRNDDHARALDRARLALVFVAELFERLVRVLDHDDRRIHHRADRNRDAAKRHDVRRQIHPPHRDERQDDGDGQRDDRHQRGTHVPEKNDADESDHDAFFNQLFTQRCDRAPDQLAAVVSRHDAHTGWQRRFDLIDFLFDTIDDVERVLAVTHHNDPTNGLAFAVQFRDSAPDIAAEMHGAHVLHVNWRAFIDFQHNVFDVGDAFDVAAATHEIFRGCDLESLAAYVGVARFDRTDDLAERDVVGDERVWIEIDLVLLYEATDRRDLSDALHRLECVTQVPILNGTQRRQIMFSAIVNQCVFVNPSHARGVGSDHRVHALRQRAAH